MTKLHGNDSKKLEIQKNLKRCLIKFQNTFKMTLTKLLKNTLQDKNRNMEEPITKTRSGRVVKRPDRYIPTEKVEDDYSTDEYDTEDDDSDTDVPSIASSSEDDDSDTEGSLADFIVDDESDSEESSK